MSKIRPTALVALTSLAVLLTACGGATASGTSSAATTAPIGSAAPIASLPVDAGGSVGILPIPSFDLSGLVASLEGVDSYKVDISTGGASQYQATVVTKPVLSRDVTLADGTRFVVIGDEAWQGTGDKLTPADSGLATAMLGAFDPALLIGGFSQLGAAGGMSDKGTEEKNGVQAHHFQIDSSSPIFALASLPPGASIDIWVAADGGYLVSMSVVGAGSDFTINVTDVNDPANKVERPA